MKIKMVFSVLILTILASSSSCSGKVTWSSQKLDNYVGIQTVNVDDFGAKADGVSDDSEAFEQAWSKACLSSQQSSILIVPNKTYYIKPTNFSGPCKSALILEIRGTIKAFTNMSLYKENQRQWIVFQRIINFEVHGGGTIDGNGQVWWDISCKVKQNKEPCNEDGAPTALTIYQCANMRVSNLRILNPPQMHVNISYCRNVEASNLTITAPENSPNTDGIHVGNSIKISIKNSVIKTGDDCISIVSGSRYVKATGIQCGPGHGISIGSLGRFGVEDHVSNVLVNGAICLGTTNGVRIKTWQGGRGFANSIIFKNVVMENVTNPIIIDQNYCDQVEVESCQPQKSAVRVMDVVYKNIRGTSASEVAIKFDCSETVKCQGIVLENVHLASEGGADAKATCKNVHFNYMGAYVSPLCTSNFKYFNY